MGPGGLAGAKAVTNVRVLLKKGLFKMHFLLTVLGMVLILEGLPYFAFPEKIKPWLQKLLDTSDTTLRGLGFGLMLFGLLMVYVGRHGII
jgi:uncharacterized protein